MKRFDAEAYREFLKREPPLAELRGAYPDVWDKALEGMREVFATGGTDSLNAALGSAQAAHDRIVKSGLNARVVEQWFPLILRTRMMVLALQNQYVAAATGKKGKVRFNLWNGWILQRLLFAGPGFVRKPVSMPLYGLGWMLVTQKGYLMPLLHKKGIYCFYSRAFVRGLARLVGDADCLEIGAGDGTLSRFLAAEGVKARATDDHSWSRFIEYPESVEKLDARAALEKHAPTAVICSWPPPGNSFERAVFQARSVRLYVAIGSRHDYASGDRAAYEEAAKSGFERSDDEGLARLLLPRELGHAVYVFRHVSGGGS
jgi:hypothetical protein